MEGTDQGTWDVGANPPHFTFAHHTYVFHLHTPPPPRGNVSSLMPWVKPRVPYVADKPSMTRSISAAIPAWREVGVSASLGLPLPDRLSSELCTSLEGGVETWCRGSWSLGFTMVMRDLFAGFKVQLE